MLSGRFRLEVLEHRLVPAGSPIAFNTGVDADGNLLPDGAVDPHYTLVSSADSTAPGPNGYVVDQAPNNPIPPWYADGPSSKWIAPQALQNVGSAVGQYDYRTTVNLANFVPSTALLTGKEATDNSLLDILVNGVSTGITESTNEFSSPTPYSIGSKFFHQGVNTIDFIVFNETNAVNPTGIRNEMTVTAQAAPTDQFAVGSDAGGSPVVTLYNPDGSAGPTLNPFPGFTGGIRTAIADLNGDGIPDVIAGTGPGTTAEVKVLSGKDDATVLFDVQPFGDFTGGVFIAAGYIINNGAPDLVVTPDVGGGPRVEVYEGGDFKEIANFYGIDDSNFRGGARAAIGDLTGDGHADLVISAGYGGGPRISIFDGAALLRGQYVHPISDFYAFDPSLRNGVYLAVGDVDGDGVNDLIFGAGPGGGPRVLIISGKTLLASGSDAAIAAPIANFFAGDQNNRGGVRVAAKNLDGDQYADVLTGAGQGGGSGVTGYLGKNLAVNSATADLEFNAFPGYAGGVFVG